MTEFFASLSPGQWLAVSAVCISALWVAASAAVFAAWENNPWQL
jgi:hypothetical protein